MKTDLRSKPLAKTFDRATERTLAILTGKWTTEILWHLNQKACRYCDLRAAIPGLSDNMLTQRLHALTDSGLIVRRRQPRSATRRYALSAKGKLLDSLLRGIDAWGQQHSRHFFHTRALHVLGPTEARKKLR